MAVSDWFANGSDIQPYSNKFTINNVDYDLANVDLVMWLRRDGSVSGHTDDADTLDYQEFITSPQWQIAMYDGSVLTINNPQSLDSWASESIGSIAFPT